MFVLPFERETTIKHSPADTYLLSILLAQDTDEIKQWVFNNFTNICIGGESGRDEFCRFTEFYNCPFLKTSQISFELVEYLWDCFSDCVKFALRHGCYIYTGIDQKYIAAYKHGGEDHNIIIYGYQEEEDKFFFCDFYASNTRILNSGNYNLFTCTSQELDMAFMGMKEYPNDKKNWGRFHSVFLQFDREYKYTFSIPCLVYGLRNFLNSTNLYLSFPGTYVDLNLFKVSSTEMEDYYFGERCIDIIVKKICESQFKSVRPLNLLYSYAVLLDGRLRFLKDNGYLKQIDSNNLSLLFSSSNTLVHISENILIRFSKMVISHKDTISVRRSLAEKVVEYKELLHDTIERLLFYLEF